MKQNLSEIPTATERRGGRTRQIERGERKIKPPAKMPIRKSFASAPDLDGAYTADQVEFLVALDRYKRENHRPFPAWTEVLNVLISLGYRKMVDPKPA